MSDAPTNICRQPYDPEVRYLRNMPVAFHHPDICIPGEPQESFLFGFVVDDEPDVSSDYIGIVYFSFDEVEPQRCYVEVARPSVRPTYLYPEEFFPASYAERRRDGGTRGDNNKNLGGPHLGGA